MTNKTAVVFGATNGIGKACANHLAKSGYSVVAVGRDKPGRKEEVIAELSKHGKDPDPPHEFRICDGFSLSDVASCATGIVQDREVVDAVVMTQSMATIQGFTTTAEGNDEKLTLNYWSRAAFCSSLLPALHKSTMPKGPVVVSVLSGGIHSPYANFKNDPELKMNYSIKNAADITGFYNDLFFDGLAKKNPSVNFVHAAPGFVNSNWGTEMPWYIKYPLRVVQPLIAKSTQECASFMVDPILKSEANEPMMERPGTGIYVMRENAEPGKLTDQHTDDAVDFVWKTTAEVLGRVGIDINKSK
jgi:NAD(P)-dependent dehydrogenase (short-subunit alcohol dehydrogenase family)